jgi:hypothetical protein
MRRSLPDQVEDLALDLLPGALRHPPRGRGAAADRDRLAVAVAVEDARVGAAPGAEVLGRELLADRLDPPLVRLRREVEDDLLAGAGRG